MTDLSYHQQIDVDITVDPDDYVDTSNIGDDDNTDDNTDDDTLIYNYSGDEKC